jgi:hypothetical protein
MKEIGVLFSIDGQEVSKDLWVQLIFKNKDSSYKDWKCFMYETVLKDWKVGTYHLEQTVTLKSAINDGQDTYPAGFKTYNYTVNIYP